MTETSDNGTNGTDDDLHDEVVEVDVDGLEDPEHVDLEGDDDIDPEDTHVEGVDKQ